MGSLAERDDNEQLDPHIVKIGQLESTPPTAADVGPIWSSVAVSADGGTWPIRSACAIRMTLADKHL